MKITEVRTRVVQWEGDTVPLPPHFCTNPMDMVSPLLSPETMGTFTFHGWLIVEIFIARSPSHAPKPGPPCRSTRRLRS